VQHKTIPFHKMKCFQPHKTDSTDRKHQQILHFFWQFM